MELQLTHCKLCVVQFIQLKDNKHQHVLAQLLFHLKKKVYRTDPITKYITFGCINTLIKLVHNKLQNTGEHI